MTTKKPKKDCDLCQGKGWFYTRSQWPAQCHRCFPEKPATSTRRATPREPQVPMTAAPKEYVTGEAAAPATVWADDTTRARIGK
jgi:hypothetical protein